MSEAKFTPGPWFVLGLASRSGELTVATKGDHGSQKYIAHLAWSRDVADKATGSRGIDDARLIAAAPDTYDVTLNANAFAALVIQWMGGNLDVGKRDILLADARELAGASLAALSRVHGEAEEEQSTGEPQ